ncbi:MAG: HIRAN domain-containing protein [Brevibacterium sp.]|uniref:HIRAN domain-containing protein n=1 Tax=Brevibacterium aurantiacum TaxID=273384 RepID=UPI003F90674B
MQEYSLDRGSGVQLAGIQHYKREVRQALGRQADDYFTGELPCQLIAEVDNPYDRNAVSVRVGGAIVGYLPAEVAAEVAPTFHRLVTSGFIPVTTCSIHWLPPREAGEEGFFAGANVSLPEPHLLLPINDPPPNSTLMPSGRSAQVIGEEDHFDMLFDYVPQQGEANLYLELRLGTRVLKNGTQRVGVYVYLDGENVGELSAATGKKFEPTLRHLDDVGKRAVVLGTIKGSALSASLTFKAAKSDEVEDSWVRSLPSAPGPFVPEAPSYSVPPAYRPPLAVSSPLPKRAEVKAKQAKSGGCALVLVTALGIAATIGSAVGGVV